MLPGTENELKTLAERKQEQIKSSITWRIGRAVTASVGLALKIITYPFKLAKLITKRRSKLSPPSVEPIMVQSAEQPPKPEIIKIQHSNKPGDSPQKTFTCIFDTFTKTCFAPEFNILTPTPGNWKEMVQSQKIDGLFIESAWHGNENSWEYLTYKHPLNNNLEKLAELINAFKDNNLPTIFWNKEDPVHFDAYLNSAAKFDYIFTTDADCIPKYKSLLNHHQVHALPFAAQHKLQNPLHDEGRNGTVCFAGSYYNFSFEERKHDMDVILKPALDFGLDIYDRNFGSTGTAATEYRFPDIYQPAIRGKLEFNEMIRAFKKYKVYLNVNSVKQSPTMFSRRVFELLACGTPVISTYSRGIIDLLGEGTVLMTESEEQTRNHLEKLLSDERYWWEKSLNGIRVVMESHTYQERVNEIFSVIGFAGSIQETVSFIISAEVKNPSDGEYLAGILREQTISGFEVFVKIPNDAGLSHEETDRIKASLDGFKVTYHHDYSPLFRKVKKASGEKPYLAPMNLSNYYGKNYLKDYKLAIKYSGSNLLGKRAYFRVEGENTISWQKKGEEFRACGDLHAGTLVIDLSVLQSASGNGFFNGEIGKELSSQGISIDPFNFLEDGRRAFESAPRQIATEIGL